MQTKNSNKTLIAYYSRTGNTKEIANLIHDFIGGDIIQIKTKKNRPIVYSDEVALNVKEQQQNILPILKTKITDFSSYKRIFIGTPTWNMALPQPVKSFMANYDFDDKIVVPFNTNAGYGVGQVFSQLKAEASGAKILNGFSVEGGKETDGILDTIRGQKRDKVSKEIKNWLKTIK